jgi:hypothetical protein
MHGTIDLTDKQLRLWGTGHYGPRRGAAPLPRRRQHCHIRTPYSWDYRLLGAKHKAVVYNVANYILRRDWETDRAPIKITTVAMARRGISNKSKWRALNELERLKLIWVCRQHGKNPVVTIRRR